MFDWTINDKNVMTGIEKDWKFNLPKLCSFIVNNVIIAARIKATPRKKIGSFRCR